MIGGNSRRMFLQPNSPSGSITSPAEDIWSQRLSETRPTETRGTLLRRCESPSALFFDWREWQAETRTKLHTRPAKVALHRSTGSTKPPRKCAGSRRRQGEVWRSEP